MKILHILHELKFSGAEIMYVDAAQLFQKKGCTLTVMATAIKLGEYAPYFERAGFKVIHNALPPLKHFFSRIKFYTKLIKLLRKGNYNVVHIHSHRAMWGFSLCAWLVHIKSVYTFHNVFPTKTITYPYHIFLRWSAKHIFKCRFQTISDSVFNHELNFYHNHTTKIYNWYGSNRFYPARNGEKELVRKQLEIDPDAFVLISVGGCSPVKRHSEIIRALPSIVAKNPNCLYLHLGKGESEMEEIQLAKEYGVAKCVRFCGNQEHVRKYLIASDVYLMPSRFEGIPITTIEAMACNIPTILYDVPGLRDFNKSGENCILIPEDHKILAEKVIYLQSNTEKSFELAERAKAFVDQNFNMETNVVKIFELYNSN
ncbi:MAG: glycosyltransferase family 4 protein [Prolixibacteraceae bacterium]|nr:glycosyltransferase family 4 protein [Prolixibacteraceae bacterium]